MNEETVLQKARETAANIATYYQEATKWRLDNIDAVEAFLAGIKRLAAIIKSNAGILSFCVDSYQEERQYPQKAKALDWCDDAVLRLNTLRDLIARAIDGDEAVNCDETDAEIIIACVDNAIDYIKQASTYATEKDEKDGGNK